MTKEDKREQYKPHNWGLYENDQCIGIYKSHKRAKKAKYFAKREARADWLDCEYKLKRL